MNIFEVRQIIAWRLGISTLTTKNFW